MKIGIGIPHAGPIHPKTWSAVFATVLTTGPRAPCHVMTMDGCYVEWNRTKLVRAAREAGCDRLLFVDADMAFEPDTLLRLLAVQHETKAAIVGVNYYTRSQTASVSTVKLHGTSGPTGETGLGTIPTVPFKCWALGTGLMLIDMAVFATLPHPWFQQTYSPETGDLVYGDDTWFCKRAGEAGHTIICDPRIPVSHIGDFEYCGQPETLIPDVKDAPTLRQQVTRQLKRALRRKTG